MIQNHTKMPANVILDENSYVMFNSTDFEVKQI